MSLNVGRSEINRIVGIPDLNTNGKIKRLKATIGSLPSLTHEGKPYEGKVIQNLTAYANSKIKNLEQKKQPVLNQNQKTSSKRQRNENNSETTNKKRQKSENNTRLENFLKNLKNGKNNIPIETILEYAKKLGYEVTSNSLSELRSKVQTKNLNRSNKNEIKTSLTKLLDKKIANNNRLKKLTEIKSKIQSNNPSNVLNGIYNAGYEPLNMVPQKLIKNYYEKSQFEEFGKALKKIKENIKIQNENIEKIIKIRINKILSTLPNSNKHNSKTATPPSTQTAKTTQPPGPAKTTQPPGPPPTQSANPPPTQSVNPPPGPKGNFAVVFNNGKPTNLKVKMNSPKPGVFTILSPPGTAKTLNLVMRNGFIMIVKKKGA